MMFDRSELEALKMGELYQIAGDRDVTMLPHMSKEELINRIILSTTDAPVEPNAPQTALEAPTDVKPPPRVHSTIEQVKEALNPFILRGMKLFHNAEENTWLIRVRLKPITVRDTNSGESKLVERWRDDSGTLHQPIETIKRCARVLMSNAPAPREVESERDTAKGMTAVA